MARLARVVIPEVAHHVTQRGNRRQQTFFSDEDYRLYLALLAEWGEACGLSILAYCLMPNHVHLVAVPPNETALTRALSEVHRRYTRHVNFRENWRGHLWQGRFASFPLAPAHLVHALRYVDENPVRSRLAAHAADWPWSSAHELAHAPERRLVDTAAIEKFGQPASKQPDGVDPELFRRHERTGRPLGDSEFVAKLERLANRPLAPRTPGRKPKRHSAATSKTARNSGT